MEPQTKEQYEKRYKENHHFSGRGMETKAHHPCPFCAAPDFFVHEVLTMKEVMARGAVCSECGRGMKVLFTEAPGTTSMEFVQTQGDDPLPHVVPMRRVS